MNSIGDRILHLRQQILKLNQRDFSVILNVSQGSLSDIEHNKRGLSIEALVNLMKYSKSDNHISLEWLLLGEDEKSPQSDLTESEREVLKLVQPLSDKDKIKVIGIIENYLATRGAGISSPIQPMYFKEEQIEQIFKNSMKKPL